MNFATISNSNGALPVMIDQPNQVFARGLAPPASLLEHDDAVTAAASVKDRDSFVDWEDREYFIRERIHLYDPDNSVPSAPFNIYNLVNHPAARKSGTRISLVQMISPQLTGSTMPALVSSCTSSVARISERDDSASGTESGTEDITPVPTAVITAESTGLNMTTQATIPIALQSFSSAQCNDELCLSAEQKRPKNKLTAGKSRFIFRMILRKNANQTVEERLNVDTFAIANVGRVLQWLTIRPDGGSDIVPLSRIVFSRWQPSCHAINYLTRAPGYLDVIIGFNSGDLIWYEPFSMKYARLHKCKIPDEGRVPIVYVQWLPKSAELFLTVYENGLIFILRKARSAPIDGYNVPSAASGQTNLTVIMSRCSRKWSDAKSGQQFNDEVRIGPEALDAGQQRKHHNPYAHYVLPGDAKVNAASINSDGSYLAVVDASGYCKIIDLSAESIVNEFKSDYGGLNCVAWSPDGQFAIAGGEDDTISLWSLAHQIVVARFKGHRSWIQDVSFDPWRCNGGDYLFGSVARDAQFLLWGFSLEWLKRQQQNQKQYTGTSQKPFENFNLRPIMAKKVDTDPLQGLSFSDDAIYITSITGHVSIWSRPSICSTNE